MRKAELRTKNYDPAEDNSNQQMVFSKDKN
jgi:hypothetical protein